MRNGSIKISFSNVFKRVLFDGTPRPKKYFEELNIPLEFIEGVKVHHWNSFPSGHTITVFSWCTLLFLVVENRRCFYLFFPISVLVSFSRIYLLQHFLIDIIAGALIGLFLATLTFYLGNKYVKGSTSWS